MSTRTSSRKPPARVWQRMLSGRRLDLLDPSPVDVEVEDIAHGLARVARWNGQSKGAHAFSVAQHSVIVEALCVQIEPRLDPKSRLLALLHDAPEYVIGDLISPFKAAIGTDYKMFELKILNAIHERFNIVDEMTDEAQHWIKRADEIAAYYEAIHLAGFSVDEAETYFLAPRPEEGDFENWLTSISALSVRDAEARFLKEFHHLFEM